MTALLFSSYPAVGNPQDDIDELDLENTFLDMHFINGERGWVVGGKGDLRSTINGGRTWQRHRLGDSALTRVAFLDSKRGWILSFDGNLFATKNDGHSWIRQALPGKWVKAFRFVTPDIGWVIGKKGEIAKTTDGGRHWKEQPADAYFDLNDIGCFTTDNCIVVGNKGIIRLTTDGGKTWERIKSPFWDEDISRVFIAADGTPWALYRASRTVMLYRSSDKGRTWKIANGDLPSLANSLFFWDKMNGIAVGRGIDLTADGGSSWRGAKVPINVPVNGVCFINRKLGWAVGSFKTILHTKDGGKTWLKQHGEDAQPDPKQ
jgi:photosystem II stability/assembly factor-like uncharacterized protein